MTYRNPNGFLSIHGAFALIVLVLSGNLSACAKDTLPKKTTEVIAAGTIRGHIVTLVSNASLRPLTKSNNASDDEKWIEVPGAKVTLIGLNTSADVTPEGDFEILNVPAGKHVILVDSDMDDDGNPELSSEEIEVEVPEDEGVDLGQVELYKTGIIKGRVRLAGQETGNEGIVVFVPGTSFIAMTDDSGAFFMYFVRQGTWNLASSFVGYGVARKSGVEVKNGLETDVGTIDLALSTGKGNGKIIGATHYGDQGSHAGIHVRAVPTTTSGVSAADGSFSINALPEGLYHLEYAANGYATFTLKNVPVFGDGQPFEAPLVILQRAGTTFIDSDGDGKPDSEDDDVDGDGVGNATDDFPFDHSESKDTDGDGIGNRQDIDDDNDGYFDFHEIMVATDPLSAVSFPAPPNTQINTGPPKPTNSATATFTFSSVSLLTVGYECRLQSAAFAPCNSPLVLGSLTDGTYVLQVRSVDIAKTVDDSPAQYEWVIDKTLPATNLLTTTLAYSPVSTATFTFSADEVATFECKIDGGSFESCASPLATGVLVDGAHSIDVRAKDLAGNLELTYPSFAWTSDTNLPQTSLSNTPAPETASTSASFTFGGLDNIGIDHFECSLGVAAWQLCNSPKTYNGLSTSTTHTFRVRAHDLVGNADATPSVWTWFVGPLNAKQISVGMNHSCVLTTANGVKCWGSNDSGQLGDATNVDKSVPVNVVGLTSGVVMISAGGSQSTTFSHTCALTQAGGVKCWGNNMYGQLGNGATTHRNTPVDVIGLASGVAAVYAGSDHSCVLTLLGGVKCWGRNTFGQLGDGSTTSMGSPVDVPELTAGVSSISVRGNHTCAMIADGLKCWGSNLYGELGDGTTINKSSPVDVNGMSSGVASASVGYDHTCAITTGGNVKCWGRNDSGQLGDATVVDKKDPVYAVGITATINAVTTGGGHSCALTTAGKVMCWGHNSYGQLGDGAKNWKETPVEALEPSTGASGLSSGFFHACALTTAGGVKCWGNNTYGQLGDGTFRSRSPATDVVGLTSGIASIAVGSHHSCALTTAGGILCWGLNDDGQVGDGVSNGFSLRPNPVGVMNLSSGVKAVSPGRSHTCAVTTAGGVKCWGNNGRGQLGNGSTSSSIFAVNVTGLASGVTAVTAAGAGGPYGHTCALTTAGGVKCWGNNEYGQLGDGSTVFKTTPVDVIGLTTGVAAVVAGINHTCALTTTGSIKCWGRNDAGQLGDGTTTSSFPFGKTLRVTVMGISTATGISANETNTCAVIAGGAAKCWGANDFSQLGDGTTIGKNAPVDVIGLNSDVSSVAAGLYHTCARTTAGGIKCWGSNFYGQLGDGTAWRTSAVPVNGFSD